MSGLLFEDLYCLRKSNILPASKSRKYVWDENRRQQQGYLSLLDCLIFKLAVGLTVLSGGEELQSGWSNVGEYFDSF